MWKQIKAYPRIILFILLFIALAVLVFIGGYRYGWPWTGFTGEKESYKTLYDWLQLLIIPLVLAIGALLFNFATTRTEQKIATKRYEQDKHIAEKHYEQEQTLALDKQREDLLQVYLDRMSALLLDKQLRTSVLGSEVRNVARVRTITLLFQLDARRIGYVFTFLRESGLMSNETNESIVSFVRANLSNINFSGTELAGVDLRKTNLSNSNLFGAFLGRANLSKTDLVDSNLNCATLVETNLSCAFLQRANLSEAMLLNANLIGAYFDEANLSGAVLIGANLKDSNITDEQLKKARSLQGAIMPDGSIHPQPTVNLFTSVLQTSNLCVNKYKGSNVNINSKRGIVMFWQIVKGCLFKPKRLPIIKEDKLIDTGLVAICIIFLQYLIAIDKPDNSQLISLILFSIAIPFLTFHFFIIQSLDERKPLVPAFLAKCFDYLSATGALCVI